MQPKIKEVCDQPLKGSCGHIQEANLSWSPT